MKIKIEITQTDNAAFEDHDREISRILHALSTTVEHEGAECLPDNIRDINGNKVGTVEVWDD